MQTAKSELSRYSRNCLCGILAAVIAFGAAFGSQKLFPDMSYINTDNIINSTVKFFTDIGEYFSLAFSGNAGGLFNGYFSSDNFLINNNIELNAPPQSANEPVLKVRSTYETGMYLVGDIGVDFTGKSWVSIRKRSERTSCTAVNITSVTAFLPKNSTGRAVYEIVRRSDAEDAYVCGLFLYLRALGITGLCGNTSCYGGKQLQRISFQSELYVFLAERKH